MTALRTALFSLTPRAFWNWGRFALSGGFALGLLIIIFLTWKAPDALLFFPVLLAGGAAVWYCFQRPLLNLCVVIGGFAVIVGYNEGISILEVAYGLYYMAYLAHWFVTRGLLREERILEEAEEQIVKMVA